MLTKEQQDLIFEKVRTLPNQAQVSIALIKHGQVEYFGIERVEDSTLIRSSQNQVFEIGSITKVFTGALLAQQILDKRLQLEDLVGQHIQLKDSLPITYQQLATHTSGLPRIPPVLTFASLDNPYKDFGEKQLLNYLSEHVELIHPVGSKFEYSNLGMGLLGYLMARLNQTSYQNLLDQHIFSQYEMHNTTTNRSLVADQLVAGLNDKGKAVPNWDLAVLMGAGGILSTVEDLTKFALAQFDSSNVALNLSRTPHFTINQQFSMGLGWSVITTQSGSTLYWHNGGTGGYTSSIILDVALENGVVILSNISALGQKTHEITGLASALIQTLD